jgi:hypothetical protein
VILRAAPGGVTASVEAVSALETALATLEGNGLRSAADRCRWVLRTMGRIERTAQFADLIVDQFDEQLAQSARQPLVCPISLHPFVTGRPYRIRRLRRALQHILQHPDRVWLTRPRDICSHIESLPAGIVPGSR